MTIIKAAIAPAISWISTKRRLEACGYPGQVIRGDCFIGRVFDDTQAGSLGEEHGRLEMVHDLQMLFASKFSQLTRMNGGGWTSHWRPVLNRIMEWFFSRHTILWYSMFSLSSISILSHCCFFVYNSECVTHRTALQTLSGSKPPSCNVQTGMQHIDRYAECFKMLELFEFLGICLVSWNCMVWQEARGPSKHGQLNRDEQPRSTSLVCFKADLDQVGSSWDVSFGA